MSNPPSKFYRHGISFECIQCGNCCSREEGWVEMTANEMENATKYLKMDQISFQHHFVEKTEGEKHFIKNSETGACIFLQKDNRCKIYEFRPQHCRTFPFWRENMKSENRWNIVALSCPGIGQGKLYDYSEIKNILKQQKK